MLCRSVRFCSAVVSNVSSANRKAGRVLLLGLVLAILPAMAHASSVDFTPAFDRMTGVNFFRLATTTTTTTPIDVNAALFCGTAYSCTPVSGLTFSFSAGFLGTLHFTNMSGVSWHSLTVTESGLPAADITCSSNLFTCSVLPDGANGARVVLTAFGTLLGVPAGQSFEIGFGCKGGGCAAWPSVNFTADVNLVPEPNTVMLALTGFGLIGSRGSFRRRHTTSA